MKLIPSQTIKPVLLCAVLPLLAAQACSKQDAAPEESTAADEAQCLELTVNLPQTTSKTALGTPVQGKYPTVWQTDDRISLNGYPSLPLSATAAGGSSASFVFRGGLSSPFNILYPATTSRDTVVFPAIQNYTAGTFDPSATPMWAGTTEYQDVNLKHLGSLLRFDIKGSVTLRSITVISAGGEALCGSFRMNTDQSGIFTGDITPLDDCSENLTLSFGENGLALKENESTPIHIAIPYGNYSKGFKAIINAMGGKVMIINFFTSEGRDIAPSKLLHFDPFTFSDGGSDVSYIFTVDDLASLKSSSATKAFLMADLDLSSSVWEPVSDWSGSFDGMGHSITGNGSTSLFGASSAKTSLSVKDLSLDGMPALTMSDGKIELSCCAFGNMPTTTINLSGGTLNLKDCSFSDNTATTATRSLEVTGGNLNASGCSFTGNGNASSTGPVVKLSLCSGNVINFDHCRFADNRNNYSGGVAILLTSTWAGKLMLNACTISGNVNSKYGCIHSQAPSSDLGGFAGIFNCLFYDNRGSSSTASKSTEAADINFAIRHIVANSTFVSTAEHLCLMNVRCGSMTAYSGGAKGCLYVNNIFVNDYSDGYCFNTAAANKYQITLGGYNRYSKAENTTYGGVTYSATDKKVDTRGSYDEETATWTWTPSAEDKTSMFSGSGSDMDSYLKSAADATYLRPLVTEFCDWLESLGAFGTDLYGNARSGEKYWPGCYQGQ